MDDENMIRPVMWDSRWVPFSDVQGGQRLILDLHPGCNGTYGQVWQDWPGRDREDDGTVIAPTFAEFSTELLRRLTTGSVVVDEDGKLLFPDYWTVWLPPCADFQGGCALLPVGRHYSFTFLNEPSRGRMLGRSNGASSSST